MHNQDRSYTSGISGFEIQILNLESTDLRMIQVTTHIQF